MAKAQRSAQAKPSASSSASTVHVLKKYPNRRLYDTQASSYIALADVKKMVLDGRDFVVRDAKTAEDLTRSILLQIILEEEDCGMPMFTTPMLAQIIRVYGHAMQGAMGTYLEKNLQTFADLQARMSNPSKALSPEQWARYASEQVPALMSGYMEQSKELFATMQEQMSKQTEALFSSLPGIQKPGR